MEILQSEYDKQFEISRHTDNKASNMLATAGTVTGLLFGFGTFLVSNIELDYQFISFAFFLLIIAIKPISLLFFYLFLHLRCGDTLMS
jgi:hypothetical protein